MKNWTKMRPLSRQAIKAYGERAARLYLDKDIPLTKAVIRILSGEDLTVEQIKRICEEANTLAYLEEFERSTPRKNVVFEGGPADPSIVVKELKHGMGVLPISEKKMMKQASAIKFPEVKQTREEVYGLLCKQASILCDELRQAESNFEAMCDHIAGMAKRAMADGETADTISSAIKLATYSTWSGNLAVEEIRKRVPEFIPTSKVKFAGRLDDNHPFVEAIREFEKVSKQLLISKEARGLADKELSEFTSKLLG
jgi:hypothetical protein